VSTRQHKLKDDEIRRAFALGASVPVIPSPAQLHGIGLTLPELHGVVAADGLRQRFPPILGPQHCAEMLGVSVATVYFWLEHGPDWSET